MAHIDKAWVIVRGIAGTALSGLLGVRFVDGSVLPSGTATGEEADGVVCKSSGTISAGEPVGVLTHGEIVEFGGSVSTSYYAGVAGSVGTASTNGTKIGKTIEGDRLIVHVG